MNGMVTVYAILIGSIVGCLFYTRDYKKEERLQYGKKQQIGDGFGLFVQDVFLKKMNKNDTFRKIYPDKDSLLEQRMFRMRQISVSVLLLLTFLLLGLFQSLSVVAEEQKKVTSIERPNENEGMKEVSLEVWYEDDVKDITIQVDEYLLTGSEIEEKIKNCYEQLIQIVLGKNESFQKITTDLNFSRGEMEGIHIQYMGLDDDLIFTDGRLNRNKIYALYESQQVREICSGFLMILSYGEVHKEYQMDVVIQLDENQRSFEEILLVEMNQNNLDNGKTFRLPETINGQKISFYEQKEEESTFYLLLGVVAIVMGILSKNEELKSKLLKRNQQLEQDYAAIVNKLTLLTGAGMTLRGAWDRIILDYEKNRQQYGFRYVYEEMKVSRKRMQNGISEAEAYSEFGRRCDSGSYIKLGCLLEQNIRKGTKGLNDCLNQEVREAFAERKVLAKKRGEETATKLLLPMMMMLIISMVIVLVPAFLSMSM